MNYSEEKLRKTWYIFFMRRGPLRHLTYFIGYTMVKRLKNADLSGSCASNENMYFRNKCEIIPLNFQLMLLKSTIRIRFTLVIPLLRESPVFQMQSFPQKLTVTSFISTL